MGQIRMSHWMIYGANGYTGRLIAEEAIKRGMKPLLAGRNRDALTTLATQHNLIHRVFDLNNPDEVLRNLEDVELVLHCAGPFSRTAAPMLNACLERNAHYLDITGEIGVFEMCHENHARAQHQGMVIAPGVGFDVVPTDCLAMQLKQRLPDANELVLAFEAGGGPSPGTAKTSIEGLGKGGRVRRNGELVTVPLAYKQREFLRDGQARSAMTIPWGDVYTAYISTGIPNIETYMVVPAKTIGRVRWLRHVQPLLGLALVQRFLKSRIDKSVPGPSDDRRRKSDCYIWGEVRNAAGKQAKLILTTPNGYDLTVQSSLGVVAHLLERNERPSGGYFTAGQLMGADYVLKLPGVKRHEVT
jgi:short subunit dehydrogenase-like uncharacterized protein